MKARHSSSCSATTTAGITSSNVVRTAHISSSSEFGDTKDCDDDKSDADEEPGVDEVRATMLGGRALLKEAMTTAPEGRVADAEVDAAMAAVVALAFTSAGRSVRLILDSKCQPKKKEEKSG